MAAIRQAATVVVLRDHSRCLQVLLVQRSRGTGFAAGAWVFPGGAVEPLDGLAADALDDAGYAAARRAAVRECREEAGLELGGGQLHPFAHWLTPEGSPKRFATWFFVAAAPGQGTVAVDGGEIIAHRWAEPAALLDEHRRGDLTLMPPTYVTLLQLQAWGRAADALGELGGRGVLCYRPRMVVRGDQVLFLYEGDAGYLQVNPDLPGPRHRCSMGPAGCAYERDVEQPAVRRGAVR